MFTLQHQENIPDKGKDEPQSEILSKWMRISGGMANEIGNNGSHDHGFGGEDKPPVFIDQACYDVCKNNGKEELGKVI